MDQIERDMCSRQQVAELSRPVKLQLNVTTEHEVAAEKVILLMRLPELRELLTDAEVDHGELHLAILRFAATNVLRLKITVGVTDAMQSFERHDYLSEHVGGKADPLLWQFNVTFPCLEAVAAVRHQNLAESLAALVPKHLWKALEVAS